jgi:hypothetical protein
MTATDAAARAFASRRMIRCALLFFMTAGWLCAERREVCSTCSYRSINSAIATASCGDVILVSADETHYGGDEAQDHNNPILLRGGKGCTVDNPITIETSAYERLPNEHTRITPNYADGATRIAALIRNVTPGPVLLAQVGDEACPGAGPCPASGYVLRGLEFCCAANYSDFIVPGHVLNYGDNKLNTLEDMATDIVFDRVLVRADRLENTRRAMTLDARNVTVMDSWVEGAWDYGGSDSTAITSFYGQNVKIINSFISGVTETIALGGAPSPIIQPGPSGMKWDPGTTTWMALPTDIEIAFNDVTKPAWVYQQHWTARTPVARGQLMAPSGASAAYPLVVAQGHGTTGDNEPNWARYGDLATTADGSVTWKVQYAADDPNKSKPNVKNLFESKSSVNLHIHHNYLHRTWPQGDQAYAFTLTSSTSHGPFQRVLNTNIEYNVIRDVGQGLNSQGYNNWEEVNSNAGVLAAARNAGELYVIDSSTNRFSAVMNGAPVDITIPNGTYNRDQLVAVLNAQFAAGSKVGKACPSDYVFILRAAPNDGSTCSVAGSQRGEGTSIDIGNGTANAVLGFTAGQHSEHCFNPRTLTYFGCGLFKDTTIHDNLWDTLNVAPSIAWTGYMFLLGSHSINLQFVHNTVVNANNHSPENGAIGWAHMWQSGYPSQDIWIRDNIFGFTDFVQPYPTYFANGGSLYGYSAINYIMCNTVGDNHHPATDSLCQTAGHFTNNILPGAYLYPKGMETYDSRPASSNKAGGAYPPGNWNDAIQNVRFRKLDDQDYALDQDASNRFLKAGTDGRDIGADFSQLPAMNSFNVDSADTVAAISFQVTDPIKSIPCVVRVSLDPEMKGVIPDLDPSIYTRPDSSDSAGNVSTDDNTRILMLGQNVALTPDTTYYYYVGCGGISRPGSFRTARPSKAPPRHATVSASPKRSGVTEVAVEWGYKYDRKSGIRDRQVTTQPCRSRKSCQIEIEAGEGKTLFYQISYRDKNGSVLERSPLRVTVAL